MAALFYFSQNLLTGKKPYDTINSIHIEKENFP